MDWKRWQKTRSFTLQSLQRSNGHAISIKNCLLSYQKEKNQVQKLQWHLHKPSLASTRGSRINCVSSTSKTLQQRRRKMLMWMSDSGKKTRSKFMNTLGTCITKCLLRLQKLYMSWGFQRDLVFSFKDLIDQSIWFQWWVPYSRIVFTQTYTWQTIQRYVWDKLSKQKLALLSVILIRDWGTLSSTNMRSSWLSLVL